MAENPSTQALIDLWKKQIEEGTQAWTRLMGQGQATDPVAFWRPFMDQGMAAWSKLFTQGPVTPDLMTQWKQFLDQWIEAWSKALGQAMSSEAFAQMMGKYVDQWLVAQAPLKKAAEQQIDQALGALNVASRSQLTSVARQIVELDERLERLEDMLADVLKRLDAGPR
jgi:hypothetical protein